MKFTLSTPIIIALLAITFQGCDSEPKTNPFGITKHSIGYLTDSTQVLELEAVFLNDSISKFKEDTGFTGVTTNINIFDKQGNPLLVLSPKVSLDSTTTITTVKIEDARFITSKGITKNSTFGDIQKAYKINKVDNLINTIVVSVNEINASFSIDKKELPANMRFDMNLNIDPIQIPEEAKIKYFMLHW